MSHSDVSVHVPCDQLTLDLGRKSSVKTHKKPIENRPLERTSSLNAVSLQDVSRQRFADMIRALYPAVSDAETARDCAAFLGCHEDTVAHWLTMDTGAPFSAVFALGAKFGVFRIAELLTKDEARSEVLDQIRRGFR